MKHLLLVSILLLYVVYFHKLLLHKNSKFTACLQQVFRDFSSTLKSHSGCMKFEVRLAAGRQFINSCQLSLPTNYPAILLA